MPPLPAPLKDCPPYLYGLRAPLAKVTAPFSRTKSRARAVSIGVRLPAETSGGLTLEVAPWFLLGMKQAFVSIVSSYVGYCVASVLRHHGYHVVGSVRAEGGLNTSPSELSALKSIQPGPAHGTRSSIREE